MRDEGWLVGNSLAIAALSIHTFGKMLSAFRNASFSIAVRAMRELLRAYAAWPLVPAKP